MKLVTIKNKYIFKPDEPPKPKKKKDGEKEGPEKKYNPNQAHIYAVYKDKETGETRLIQMTHVIEPQKKSAIKMGRLMMVQLPNVDMPSGVKNEYYTIDINGDPIDLKKIKAADIPGKNKKATYVRKSLAEKIIAFAKKKHK